MEASYSETESPVFPSKKQTMRKQKKKNKSKPEGKDRSKEEESWPRKNKFTLEGYIEPIDQQEFESSGNVVGRTKSLTDEDLEELKGCLDLGFGFSYDEIPELCNTLPALELCYSMSQRYLEDQHRASDSSSEDSVTFPSSSSSQVASWKISSPGDHPDEVKARLKYWAQTVACTVRLCS